MSCVYCILAGLADLAASATNPENHAIYREMVDLEIVSSFSFQSDRWLADVAPHLLSVQQLTGLREAKHRARLREQVEAKVPAHLLYKKGWPTIRPTKAEAVLLSEVRRAVSEIMQFQGMQYTEPEEISARYAELIAINEQRHGSMIDAVKIVPLQQSLWNIT